MNGVRTTRNCVVFIVGWYVTILVRRYPSGYLNGYTSMYKIFAQYIEDPCGGCQKDSALFDYQKG